MKALTFRRGSTIGTEKRRLTAIVQLRYIAPGEWGNLLGLDRCNTKFGSLNLEGPLEAQAIGAKT